MGELADEDWAAGFEQDMDAEADTPTPPDDVADLVRRLWESDQASALTNEAARAIEALLKGRE